MTESTTQTKTTAQNARRKPGTTRHSPIEERLEAMAAFRALWRADQKIEALKGLEEAAGLRIAPALVRWSHGTERLMRAKDFDAAKDFANAGAACLLGLEFD